MKPFLLILSAPSGGGKTTIAKALVTARDDVAYSVSATTRAPREGERDGIDYHFLSEAEFTARRGREEFLEWAEYSGCYYGTLKQAVREVQKEGRHVVLDIEVQGARLVRERYEDGCGVVSIFILPPSAEVLVQRLTARGQVDPEKLRLRLLRAQQELEAAAEYDYIVVNEDRTQVVSEVAAIIDSESRRTCRIGSLDKDLLQLRQGLNDVLASMSSE
jgi:guanylate kinase